MSAPIVISFDVLDDTKLLPVWDILTNTEAIAINQAWAGSPGVLLRKWSAHAKEDPLYAWAEKCNATEPAQRGWSYDVATRTVQKAMASNGDAGAGTGAGAGGDVGCLAAASAGQSLTIVACNDTKATSHTWVLDNKRLWQGAQSPSADLNGSLTSMGVGALSATPCDADQPGQRWSLTSPPGKSLECNVQNNLTSVKSIYSDYAYC